MSCAREQEVRGRKIKCHSRWEGEESLSFTKCEGWNHRYTYEVTFGRWKREITWDACIKMCVTRVVVVGAKYQRSASFSFTLLSLYLIHSFTHSQTNNRTDDTHSEVILWSMRQSLTLFSSNTLCEFNLLCTMIPFACRYPIACDTCIIKHIHVNMNYHVKRCNHFPLPVWRC